MSLRNIVVRSLSNFGLSPGIDKDFIRHVLVLSDRVYLAGSRKLASSGGRARMRLDHQHHTCAQRQPVVPCCPPPTIRPDSAKRSKALSKISMAPLSTSPTTSHYYGCRATVKGSQENLRPESCLAPARRSTFVWECRRKMSSSFNKGVRFSSND